jgi:Sec-independent protein translocase protein TatA
LPELAKSIGIGIREFKKACQGMDVEIETPPKKEPKEENESVVITIDPINKNKS